MQEAGKVELVKVYIEFKGSSILVVGRCRSGSYNVSTPVVYS